jgi:hypothetical protein
MLTQSSLHFQEPGIISMNREMASLGTPFSGKVASLATLAQNETIKCSSDLRWRLVVFLFQTEEGGILNFPSCGVLPSVRSSLFCFYLLHKLFRLN